MKRLLIPALLAWPISAVFAAASAASLDPTAPQATPPALTLASALRRAAENNPALAAQHYGERAAEARIEQAGLRPNPTLDVGFENFLGTGQVQGVRRLEATVQASQTLERGGKREKRLALAGRTRDTAALEVAVLRSEVLTATAIAFAETLAAQQRLALAGEPLQLARDMLTAVNARVQSGAASSAEAARSRAAVASAQAEYTRRASALIATRSALAATWGGRPTDVGELPGRIQLPPTAPPEGELPLSLEQHPRLALQAAIVAVHRAALDLEQAQAVGDITLGGGVRFLREGTDATLVAGVSVPLPVRHKNQGNIRAARETLAGAEQATRAVETELRVALTTAWQSLQAAHAAAHHLRHDALPATEEACAIVRRAYDQGELPLIDVLDAQRALVEIRREILDAEAAYAIALARIEGLTAPTFPATTALLFPE